MKQGFNYMILHIPYVNTIRYDTIAEFNMESKAECDQLNLAHETKTNKRQCPLSSVYSLHYRFEIREGSPEEIRRLWRKRFVKEMSFKSGVKGWESDRWWAWRWWLWWGDMRRIGWIRRIVNRMRLTEWRRELINLTTVWAGMVW